MWYVCMVCMYLICLCVSEDINYDSLFRVNILNYYYVQPYSGTYNIPKYLLAIHNETIYHPL